MPVWQKACAHAFKQGGEHMEYREIFWKLFEKSGSLDAYIGYCKAKRSVAR
jgi:hypothetical protein